MEPRGYQMRCIDELRAAFRDKYRAPLLVLPTGGGKTFIGSWIAKSAVERGGRVLVLVHRKELLKQWAEALQRIGVDRGLIHPAYTAAYYKPCQIASVQTLVKRIGTLEPPTLIVVDEAHHAPAGTWQKILSAYPDAKVLGVTATPVRADGKGLKGMFDAMVVGSTIRELIDAGYLVEPLVLAPHIPELKKVRTTKGDYNQQDVSREMDKPTITGDALMHYRKWADGEPAVVFCASVAHARNVAAVFAEAGYRAACVDGNMSDEERDAALSGLATGAVQVVTSCDIISEGTDIPAVACAILLRPTKSLSLFIQQVGRALRPAPGKSRAIILDHAGNTTRFGLPDEDREWSLAGGVEKKKKNEEKKITIKVCDHCFHVHKPNLKACPECGFTYKVKSREIAQVKGELVPLSRAEVAAQKVRDSHKNAKAEVLKAKSLQECLEIAKKYNYKPFWAEKMWEWVSGINAEVQRRENKRTELNNYLKGLFEAESKNQWL